MDATTGAGRRAPRARETPLTLRNLHAPAHERLTIPVTHGRAVRSDMGMNALDLVYGCAALATAPWWMRKAHSGWGERFARVLPHLAPKTPGRPRVLLHAVSVGETNALRG